MNVWAYKKNEPRINANERRLNISGEKSILASSETESQTTNLRLSVFICGLFSSQKPKQHHFKLESGVFFSEYLEKSFAVGG